MSLRVTQAMKQTLPLKVCYFLKRYPRISQTFIVNEMKELQRQGVHVTIVARSDSGETSIHEKALSLEIPVYYLPPVSSIPESICRVSHFESLTSKPSLLGPDIMRGALSIKDYRAMIQAAMIAPFIKSLGVDIIHAHFATSATTAASVVSAMTGIPYTFTAHAKDIYHKSVDKKALSKKISNAKFAITVSDYNKKYLEEILLSEGKSGNVIRLYNGIDLDQFNDLELDREQNLLVGIGRLVPKKGFHFLIMACNILNKRGAQFHCVIAGEGEERGRLEELITEYSLSKKVSLLGVQMQTEINMILQKATACVLPCIVDEDGDRDGLPTVLLEAMAVGTPVVSTRVTGIPEIITHNQTGLLIDQKNPEALADAILILLDSESARKRLSCAAKIKVRKEFNLKENVKTLKNYFLSKKSLSSSLPVEVQSARIASAIPVFTGQGSASA
jgi:glycosyltransferase involved in cell wall biosynthesis